MVPAPALACTDAPPVIAAEPIAGLTTRASADRPAMVPATARRCPVRVAMNGVPSVRVVTTASTASRTESILDQQYLGDAELRYGSSAWRVYCLTRALITHCVDRPNSSA